MKALMTIAKREYRLGMILTCKEELIGFYEQFGYKNMGISKSVHGGVVWYDMLLCFDKDVDAQFILCIRITEMYEIL